MKNLWFAVIGTLGAAACGGGETKPPDSPTPLVEPPETTTTSAAEATRRNEAQPATPRPLTSTAPATEGLDTTPPTHDTSGAGTTTGAPATQNQGGADKTTAGALTPMDQGGGKADRDITAAVRRSLVGDTSLSLGAKNVKIITVAGKVTLRGVVKSDAERSTIESKAKAAPGVIEVDNQLEVKK